MYRNILVPLDGTRLSERALDYAEPLAERIGAELTLVRAAHAPFNALGDAGIDAQRGIMIAEGYLESLRAQLSDRGLHVQIGIPFGGSAAKWIVEEIALRHADLVVMATHTREGPTRWIHGSVAEAVVGQASVPVMLVQPSTD